MADGRRFWNVLGIRTCSIIWAVGVFLLVAAVAYATWRAESRYDTAIRQIQENDEHAIADLEWQAAAVRGEINQTPAPDAEEVRAAATKLLKASETYITAHRDGIVRTYRTDQEFHDSQETWRNALLAVIALSLGAGMAGFWLGVIRPIGELQRAAASLQAGDYEARASARRSGEIGALRRALNELGDTLSANKAEHQRAEEELQNLTLLADMSPHPLMRASNDGRVLYANQAAAALLSVWNTAVGAATPPVLSAEIQEALNAHTSRESRILCGNRAFLFVFVPMADRGCTHLYGRDITARERMVNALVQARDELEKRVLERTTELNNANQALQADILERSRAEKRLRESEARFHGMFEDAPIGMMLVSADGHVLEANRAQCEFLGYPAQELAGMSVLDVTYPDDRDESTRVIRRMYEGGVRIEGHQERYVRKNGEVVWGEASVSIITDVDGKLIHTIAQIVDITERRRAEEALREKEETIRALLNATTDKVFLLDTDGVILAANEMSARGYGKRVGQLAGTCVYDFMTPDVAAARKANVSNCVQSGQPMRFEDEHRGVWYDNLMSPIRDSQGKVTRLAIYARDITERKRADEALRESEARFRSTFENAPIGMTVVSPDQHILHANRAHGEFLGYSAEELTGMSVVEVTYPEDREATSEVIRDLHERGIPIERYPKRYRRKDGAVVWGEVSVSLVRDTQGKVTYSIAQIVDITERRRTEEALRESEQRYRELFEASPIGLIEGDWTAVRQRADQLRAEGVSDVRAWFLGHPEEAFLCMQRLDANKAALRLFKAPDKREFLTSFDRLVAGESRQTTIQAIAALAAGDALFETESSLETYTGEKRNVLLSISTAPVDEKPLRYIASLSDITDLRQAQQEAAEQRQAAQLQRMESLAVTGRLAAGVAHEINNPLQGIVAQLTLLAGELPEPLRQGRRIELIQDGIDRIAGIVRNLLQLHRPAPAGEESCAVSSVIPGLADMISAMTTNQRIRLEVSVSPPEMTVPVSASALMQVLLNLVLNAIDAMPQGGILRIEAKRTAEAVVVGVSDTGVGIPPEHRTRLFSPFFTTKGPKGTGLGLSVTYSLVTSAGGTITVNDQKGGGTTFAIRFGE